MSKYEAVVGPVRFSFLYVNTPRDTYDKDDKEYSLVGLIPKKPCEFCKDPEGQLKALQEVIEKCAKDAHLDESYRSPIQDGDKVTRKDGSGNRVSRYPGYWFFTAKAKGAYPPTLIDGRNKIVPRGDDFGWVSGDWGRVKVSAFSYNRAGNQGVSLGLRAVQFLYHDEPFGSNPLSGFDEVPDADPPRSGEAWVEGDPLDDDPFKVSPEEVGASWFDNFSDGLSAEIRGVCERNGLNADVAAREVAGAVGVGAEEDDVRAAFYAWFQRQKK